MMQTEEGRKRYKQRMLIGKFFGIILLAISVRLFTSNIMPLISSFSTSAP